MDERAKKKERSRLNRNKFGGGVMDPLMVVGKIGTLEFVISSTKRNFE